MAVSALAFLLTLHLMFQIYGLGKTREIPQLVKCAHGLVMDKVQYSALVDTMLRLSISVFICCLGDVHSILCSSRCN